MVRSDQASSANSSARTLSALERRDGGEDEPRRRRERPERHVDRHAALEQPGDAVGERGRELVVPALPRPQRHAPDERLEAVVDVALGVVLHDLRQLLVLDLHLLPDAVRLVLVGRTDGLRAAKLPRFGIEHEERGAVKPQAEAGRDAREHRVQRVVEVGRAQHLPGQRPQGRERGRLGGEGLEGARQRGRFVERVEDAGAHHAQVRRELARAQVKGAARDADGHAKGLPVRGHADMGRAQGAPQERELHELPRREGHLARAGLQARLHLAARGQAREQRPEVGRHGRGEDRARQGVRQESEPAVGHVVS